MTQGGKGQNPKYTITSINKVTGEKKSWAGKSKKQRLEEHHAEKKAKAALEEQKGADAPSEEKSADIKPESEPVKDTSIEYFAKVEFKGKNCVGKVPMFSEKDSEQLAAFEALKTLKVVPEWYKFEQESQKTADTFNKEAVPKRKADMSKHII